MERRLAAESDLVTLLRQRRRAAQGPARGVMPGAGADGRRETPAPPRLLAGKYDAVAET
jgi:hypothetical protein